MKLAPIKLKSSAAFTTLFVAGIIVSGGGLYEQELDPSKVSMIQINACAGLTFLMGLIAIHFTRGSIKQTTVYLEKNITDASLEQVVAETDSELDFPVLYEIIRGGENVSENLVREIARQLEAGQVALYGAQDSVLELKAGFALSLDRSAGYTCDFGEGLPGRVAKEGRSVYIDNVPSGYITVFSGLGSTSPTFLAIIPMKCEDETRGVLEIALFRPLAAVTLAGLENVGNAWAGLQNRKTT